MKNKKVIKTQLNYNTQQKNLKLSGIKLSNIQTKKQALEIRKREINAIKNLSSTSYKKKNTLSKKKNKLQKQIDKQTKKQETAQIKFNKIQKDFTNTQKKLSERKAIAGITTITTKKESMTPQETAVFEQRQKNFTYSVSNFKNRWAIERKRKKKVQDNRLSNKIETETKKFKKLQAKKAEQDLQEKPTGFFGKMFNGFKKKVGNYNITRKGKELEYLYSKIGKNSQTIAERIKSRANKIKKVFTRKSTLERRKRQKEEAQEKALQESNV